MTRSLRIEKPGTAIEMLASNEVKMIGRLVRALLAVYILCGSLQSWAKGELCSVVTLPEPQTETADRQFTRWNLADFIAHHTDEILLSCDECPTLPQRISVTGVSQTPSLFAHLLDLAGQAKFIHRAQAKNALKVMEERQFNAGMSPTFLHDEVDQRTRNRIRRHNLRFQALLETASQVEMGAWDITLQNGEHRTAIFTTNDQHQVAALDKSLQGLLATIPTGQKINQIQFIHNHPTSVSLSRADQTAMVWTKSFVRNLGFGSVPVLMTAIHEMEDAVIAMTIAI